ncbi:hypothetical protein QBC42DRAFT_253130 [Cladorrhinum samala]|uniref:Uncharacterized protein n=1 Tax=Cladorrhinum samala TaxID=585594 RepID=A0AAV9HJ73_9PEZI|nr:hypothetical protein QBC42DRAFT_253130 [Cladorrhinum samala]
MPRWLEKLRNHIQNTCRSISHRLHYPQNRRPRPQRHQRNIRRHGGRRRHHNLRGRTRRRNRPLSPHRPREHSPQRHAASIYTIDSQQPSPGESNPRRRSEYDYAQRAGTTYARFYIYDNRSYHHCSINHNLGHSSCNCHQPSCCPRRANIRTASPAESVHSTIVIEELQPGDPPRQRSPSPPSPPSPPRPNLNQPNLANPSPNSPSPSSPLPNPPPVASPTANPTATSGSEPSSAQPASQRPRDHERRLHRRNNGHPQHTPLATTAQPASRTPHVQPRSPAESEYSTFLVEEPLLQSNYVAPTANLGSAQPAAPQPTVSSSAPMAGTSSTTPARWNGGWHDIGWGRGVSVSTAPYVEEQRLARQYMSREDFLAYYGTPRSGPRSGRPGPSESLWLSDPDFPHYYRST